MTETWNECPLYGRYQNAKIIYLNELREEKKRRLREEQLMDLIEDAFHDVLEPKREYWINRMFHYYSKRLHYLKTDYVTFLGELSDASAYADYVDEKSRRYCLMIRDKARERVGIPEIKIVA